MKMDMERLGVVILAGGKGTRMKSDLPKALHPLKGKPMALWTIEAARALNPEMIVVIVGHGREKMMETLAGQGVQFAIQEPQLGTGHALACASEYFAGFDGAVVVLSADVPAIRPDTLAALIQARRTAGAAVALLSCVMENPGAYGRVARNGDRVTAIVEAKDATADQLAIREINSGIYAFDARFVFSALPKVGRANAQGEYYLTDVVGLAVSEGKKVVALPVDGQEEIQGVNTVDELAALEKVFDSKRD